MKSLSINLFELVSIDWIDIVDTSPQWQTIEEAIEWAETETASKVNQVGYIIKETEDYIVVAHQFNKLDRENWDEILTGNVTKIQKGNIKSLWYISGHKLNIGNHD